MRRKTTDFSYKERTSEIIKEQFHPWQLSYKDAREGFHRFINRVVSLIQELDTEGTTIENMFFPEQMNLSEEWVVYHPYPLYPLSDIYLSGEPINQAIGQVESIDDMLAGSIDIADQVFIMSGIPEVHSMVALDSTNIYLSNSGMLTHIDVYNNTVIASGTIDTIVHHDELFYCDIYNTMYPIREAYREGTVRVTRSGVIIPFEIHEKQDLTGIWNEDFDIDNNGIIGSYEQATLESAYGISSDTIPPSEWSMYEWMDVNGDGIISESDYTAVMSAIPSAAPDVFAIIEVPYGNADTYTVTYEKKLPQSLHIYRHGQYYAILDDEHPLSLYASKVTYDSHTDSYYGINYDETELRAYRYDSINNEIVDDVLIYIPLWSHNCRLNALDTIHGILYLVVSDGTISKIFYGDIWGETVEAITQEATIPALLNSLPQAFSALPDGYFILYTENKLIVLKGSRDKVIEIDGVPYFNRRHTVTHKNGTPLKTVPHRIFNNWDSFAYSFGIERPLGCDNLCMKRLIMDFWKHMQGNTAIGMNYGIVRELGYDNYTVIPSGLFYDIPSPLTCSGEPPLASWDIIINGHEMTVFESYQEEKTHILLSGSIGTIRVENGTRLFPDEMVSSTYGTLAITGYYKDGNNDPIRLTANVSIRQGTSNPVITAQTYGDYEFLNERGYIISGEPSEQMITLLHETEINDPFIYANAHTDITPMDSRRISQKPLIPTVYDPCLSGLVVRMSDVETII